MYLTPQSGMINRRRFQICKIVIATSLVWFMIDVFLLMYFTDCGSVVKSEDCENSIKMNVSERQEAGAETPVKSRPVALEKGSFQHLPKGTPEPPRKKQPGDGGKAVAVPPEKQDEMKKLFQVNQFNLLASDLMSLNRSLPDYRMEGCRKKSYPVSSLPDTSIVIVFHNEAWSTLLRTIWSIITRSPEHLVKEIILVDDASEKDFLGKQLDDYVSQLPISTYIVRMGSRTGLIRARLRGASQAKGKVITFLDAHCECTEGWLEPLLYEIYKNRTSVVCPIIDVISDDTFEYIVGSDMTWGGFNWRLNFRWYGAATRELERRGGDRSLPMRTPAMAGGLLSIDRAYFYEIGAYDPGMDIWGGENIEMSFRVWMCGGQIMIVTCSRVGHVFRKVSPYSWPGGVERILNHNTRRTAEVWMGKHKEFVYRMNPAMAKIELGDISERVNLKKSLKCHSFEWYLENIYPESLIPSRYFSLGYIAHKMSGLCLDTVGRKSGERVALVHCAKFANGQTFVYTHRKEVMHDEVCLDATRNGVVTLLHCHHLGGNQLWSYDRKTSALRHVSTNMCLSKPSPKEPTAPALEACTGDEQQKWTLENLDLTKYSR